MQFGVLSFNIVFALVPNLLIPRQKFFKYVRIGQKLHAWQNFEQQLEVSEHIKPVCFCCLNNAVYICARFRTLWSVAEQPVLSADGERSYRILCGVVRYCTVAVFEVVPEKFSSLECIFKRLSKL